MLLQDFKPCSELTAWIRCYRVVHFNFKDGFLPPPKPYTPRPEQCIAFYPLTSENVKYPDKSRSISKVNVALIGQHSKVTYREVGREFLVVQVIFQPGALYRLTGIPASELFNEYLEADLILGTDVHFVNEQLYHAKSYEEMLQTLDLFFIPATKKVKRDASRVDPLIRIFEYNRPCSLDDLSKKAFYSFKQFERHFYVRTGVTPRYYQRLVRFDHAFRMKNMPHQKSWREIAWDCQYTDYQHLVKDYKEFTGYSPVEFHALGSPEESLGIAETFYEMEERNNKR